MYVYELRKNQTLSFDIGENKDNEIISLNVINGKILCCTSLFGLETYDLKTLDKVTYIDTSEFDLKNVKQICSDNKIQNLFCSIDDDIVKH